MRTVISAKLEAARITTGPFATGPRDGPNGYFLIHGPCGATLKIVTTDGIDPISQGWEHCSISVKHRCPNWQEMCFVKDLFWDEEECVIQLHPPKSQYINNHETCLHMWKPPFPMLLPPSVLVGTNKHGVIKNELDAARIQAITHQKVE